MTKKERNIEFAKMLKEYPKYFGRMSFRDRLLVRVAFDYVLDAEFAQTHFKFLNNRLGLLEEKYYKLKDTLAQTIENDEVAYETLKLHDQEEIGMLNSRVAELEQQIEKMKCCGNCRFSESDTLNGTFCHREGCFVVASAKCKLWEM